MNKTTKSVHDYLIDNDSWFLGIDSKKNFIWHDSFHLRWELMEETQNFYPHLYFGWLGKIPFPQIMLADEIYI